MKELLVPGFHVRGRWADLIMTGKKTIETRSYSLPIKYENKWLALIHTNPAAKAQIIGLVKFSQSFKYDEKKWLADFSKHKVPNSDASFGFYARKSTWGWIVQEVIVLKGKAKPPVKRGIKFARECKIPIHMIPKNHTLRTLEAADL